jgi:ABC-type nitrate/sulfonate/bicarbonate transport system permease component
MGAARVRSVSTDVTSRDGTVDAAPTASARAAVVPRLGRSARRGLRRYLPPVALLAAFFALWQLLVSALGVDPAVLPGPRRIVWSTFDDRADLWPNITTTTEEAVLGLLLAIVVAVVLAVSIDSSRNVRGSVYPLIVASQTLPIIALAPLVVIWFGFGLAPKIWLVALFSFFPIVVGTVQGLASADRQAVDLLRTMGASRLQLLLRVRLPGALPQFFTGLKIAVTYAFTSAIVAEFLGAPNGLGVYMQMERNTAPVRTDLVLGATFVTAVLTVALFVIVSLLQRIAMPWRPPTRS